MSRSGSLVSTRVLVLIALGVVIAFLIVIARECRPAPGPPTPTPTVTPEPTPPVPGPSSSVRESYVLEQIHRAWAGAVDPTLQQLWGWCGGVGSVDSSQWAEHKVIRVVPASGGRAHATQYQFSALGYDADQTRLDYGEPVAVESPTTLPGSRYIYDLRAVRGGGKFSQTDSITLTQDRSVTVTHGMEFDASVKSTTTVEGEYLGAKVEQELEVTLGYKDSEETARAEAESKSITTSHTFDLDLDGGRITYISIDTGDISSSTPLSIDGVADATVTVTFGQPCAVHAGPGPTWWQHSGQWLINPDNEHIWDCWSGNSHGASAPIGQGEKGWINWANWINSHPCPWTTTMGEVLDLVDGMDAAWQGLAGDRHGSADGWLARQAGVYREGLEHATGPSLRRVHLSGLQQRAYQRGSQTVVTYIDPGEVSGLVDGGATVCDPHEQTCNATGGATGGATDNQLIALLKSVGAAGLVLEHLPDTIGTALVDLADGPGDWLDRLAGWEDATRDQSVALQAIWDTLDLAVADDADRVRILGDVTAVWQAVGGIEAAMIASQALPLDGLDPSWRERIDGWATRLDGAERDLTTAIGVLDPE